MRRFKSLALVAVAVLAQTGIVSSAHATGRGNDNPLGTIYVESQGLYYDTFKTTDLPPEGEFQQLFPNGTMGPTTLYGPGEPGYVGGRWWIDTNKDGIMDELDTYFSCPLLGPGRTEP